MSDCHRGPSEAWQRSGDRGTQLYMKEEERMGRGNETKKG